MNPVETLFMSPAFAEARRHLTRSQVTELLDAARALSLTNEELRSEIARLQAKTDRDIAMAVIDVASQYSDDLADYVSKRKAARNDVKGGDA